MLQRHQTDDRQPSSASLVGFFERAQARRTASVPCASRNYFVRMRYLSYFCCGCCCCCFLLLLLRLADNVLVVVISASLHHRSREAVLARLRPVTNGPSAAQIMRKLKAPPPHNAFSSNEPYHTGSCQPISFTCIHCRWTLSASTGPRHAFA
jgi:hypothetical protein